MGWLTNLLGGSENAGKALDMADSTLKGVGTWIDEMKLTDEERMKATQAAVASHLELVKVINEENSKRSVTRRWLAWGIGGYILGWGSVAMVFAMMDKMNIVDNMLKVVNALNLGMAFVTVVGLYFGVQFLRARSK